MQVVLLEDMKGLGARGDTCTVKDGYAMNFLIPNKKAAACTGSESKQVIQKRVAAKERKQLETEQVAALIPSLPETLTIPMATNESGKLFSAVTKELVAETLRGDGFAVDEAWLSFDPIKTVGSHTILVQKDAVEKTVTLVIEAQ